MSVIEEIAAERQRQIDAENWTTEHDDRHRNGELAKAGSAYALYAAMSDQHREIYARKPDQGFCWPWSISWWKPKNRRRDLIRAAALIVAEIERLDRQST